MIYAQVDVELRDHERITGAELADVPEEWRPAARAAMLGLFAWCLCYAQAKRSKEGLLPREAVHGALNGGQKRTASHLVASGLLEEFSSHYRIRNFALKNQTGEQIEAKQAAAAARQARWRASRNALVTRDSRVSPGVGVGVGDLLKIPEDKKTPEVLSGGESERGPEPDERPSGLMTVAPPAAPADNDVELSAAARRAAREGELREAYRRGIEAGKGGPFAWIHRWNRNTGQDDAQGDLHEAIRTFAKGRDGPYRGKPLEQWLEDYAHDFAQHVTQSGDDPRFWSDFQAKGFLKFMNVDTRKREARKHG